MIIERNMLAFWKWYFLLVIFLFLYILEKDFILLILIFLSAFKIVSDFLSEKYFLEETSLTIKKFEINRKIIEKINYSDIISMKINRSFIGKRLNFGDIEIQAKDKKIILKNVKNPDEIVKIISKKTTL